MNQLLLVEDDTEYAGVVKQFYEEVPKLFGGGAEFIVLQTLAMMRHVLATNTVELIILDLTLPDSIQAKTIEFVGRERSSLPPIYVLTGDERLEVRQQCIAVGAVGFAIKKHVIESPNFFFACIFNEVLKHREHRRQL